MYLVLGKKPYGKCDVVPELFHVATLFFHIDYVPLVPLGSYLVLSRSGKEFHGIRIRFSLKSLLCAWSRLGFLAAALAAWITALVSLQDRQLDNSFNEALVAGLLFTAGFALVMVFPRKASYARACELAQAAGLNDTGWAALNVQYGRDPFDRPGQNDVLIVR